MKAFKNLDDKHAHRWRAIACCYLDGKFNPDDKIAKLSQGIGLALLKQCFEAIPQIDKNLAVARSSNKQSKTPTIRDFTSPAIQNAVDLQLLLLIYKDLDMDEQALSILDSEEAGLKSEVGFGHWDLILHKLKLLKTLHRTEESWKFCYQLLREAAKIELDEDEKKSLYNYGKSGDDLIIWRAAAENVYELKDVSILLKFQELLEHPGVKKRHRLLATIDLALKIDNERSVFVTFTTSFVDALQNYLDHYLHTGIAYEDLRGVAEKLLSRERAGLLKQVQKMQIKREGIKEGNEQEFRSKMHTQLNELKLRYTIEISNPDNVGNIPKLETFANLCVSLYLSSLKIEKKYAITERRTGDEAAILAASTFIHLWEFKHRKASARLQATLILEKLLENSKHHYGAILMLVRLYVLQGCFDLAYKYYSKLNLKNVQHLSETWVLLDRVASIFPYKHQERNEDIHELLQTVASYTESKTSSLHSTMEIYKSTQNWSKLCEIHELLNTSKVSISRAGILGELSRFYYHHQFGDCFGDDTMLDHMITIQNPNKGGVHADVRSDKGFPNYEDVESKQLEKYLRGGPKTGEMWIQAEDLMYKWRRWTKLRLWATVNPDYHKIESAKQLDFMSVLQENFVKRFDDLSNPVDDLTGSERIVAYMLSIMTSVEESTHALSLGCETLTEAHDVSVNDWKFSDLADYEKLWTVCTMVFPHVYTAIDRTSEMFKNSPLSYMNINEWESLHCYYKPTELFTVVPGFLLDRIMNARAFHKIAMGSDFPFEDFEIFNVSALEDLLRTFLASAFKAIKQWQVGTRRAFAHWNNSQKRENLVSKLCGTGEGTVIDTELKKNLESLFGKAWTREKFLDITRGWQNALEGMMLETPEYWHRNRMPVLVEKYMPKL